jgi:hypothetical protein
METLVSFQPARFSHRNSSERRDFRNQENSIQRLRRVYSKLAGGYKGMPVR